MEVGCFLLGGKRLVMGRQQAPLCVPDAVWDATGAPPLCPPWRRCEPRSPSSPGSQGGRPPLPRGLSAGPGRGQDRAWRWALQGRALPYPLPLPPLGEPSASEPSLRKSGRAAPPRMVWVINRVTLEKSSLDHGVLHSSLQSVGDLINLLADVAAERYISRCIHIPFQSSCT